MKVLDTHLHSLTHSLGQQPSCPPTNQSSPAGLQALLPQEPWYPGPGQGTRALGDSTPLAPDTRPPPYTPSLPLTPDSLSHAGPTPGSKPTNQPEAGDGDPRCPKSGFPFVPTLLSFLLHLLPPAFSGIPVPTSQGRHSGSFPVPHPTTTPGPPMPGAKRALPRSPRARGRRSKPPARPVSGRMREPGPTTP